VNVNGNKSSRKITVLGNTAAKQAAVLKLSRSTAWKILKGDHKQSGLSAGTIHRMLAWPDLPPAARKIIDEYVQEKLQGAYPLIVDARSESVAANRARRRGDVRKQICGTERLMNKCDCAPSIF
jgi:hypothetical protein